MIQATENKELLKYYIEIQEEVKASLISEEEGTTPEQIFSEYILSILADAGETENYRVSYDEKISKRGTEHKVNGYALYENYETLDLFVTLYFEDDDIQTLTKTETEKAIDKLGKFFRNAIYKDYINEIEESSQIFDLAHTLSNVPEVREFLARVNIFLITNGVFNSDIKYSETIAGYSVFYRVIDINYLYNISFQARMPIEIDFQGEGFNIPCIINDEENSDYQSYLAIIPGNALASIYEQYGSRLLEQNVRSFLQFTGKNNRGIRDTILNMPHMFLAYNNGIAATAEEIELEDLGDKRGIGIAKVKDFQIVNGGQTTASIYHTWKKNKGIDISKIYVQLKLTIIKDKENFSDIVGRIAEYANTQNKVSTSDLSSNRENHVILEKISRTVWAPAVNGQIQQTRWFFERARGQYKNARLREGFTPSRRKAFDLKNPRKQVITKENLAKYINCWGEVYKGNKLAIGPHVVVRGAQKNYVQFLTNNYKEKPDNVFFEDVVAKAILFKTAEKIYGVKPNAIGDMRYITVPYAISWLGYKLQYKLDLYEIWKAQDLNEMLKEQLRFIMQKIEQFIKENAPGSLYGEWAKREECWDRIKNENLIDNMDSLTKLITKNKGARRRMTEDDINNVVIQSELTLIKSIPIKKWSEISKLGSYITEITPHQKDRAINVMSTLKQRKVLSDKQRIDAIKIIDILVKKMPDFFNSDKPENGIDQKIETEPIELNQAMIVKMVEWDTKAKVLTPGELQYVADFAYGLKTLNSFHENNIKRHLAKLIEAGFS